MGLAAMLSAVLAGYCRLVERRPCALLLLYTAVVAAVIGVRWRPLQVESDFASFIRADGPAMRQRDAYLLALATKKGPAGRRLAEEPPAAAEGRARLLDPAAARSLGDGVAWWEAERSGRSLQAAQQETIVAHFELTLIYEAVGGDVFEERALREVRDLELSLRSLPGWRELCLARTASPSDRFYCDPGESLAAYAWPSQVAPTSGDRGRLFTLRWDAQGSELLPVPAMLGYLQRSEHQVHDLERFLPPDFHPPAPGDNRTDLGQPRIAGPRELRTQFSFNVDLSQAAATHSMSELKRAFEASREEYRRLIQDEVYPLLLRAQDSLEAVRVRYFGNVISGYEVDVSLQGDIMWAVGAMLFVALSLWLHSRSLSVTCASLVLVFAAVPLAYVLTPSAKITIASFLSLFLIAGIGSDVVFVFCDFWDQSRLHCSEGDLSQRLSWLFAHAGVNCLATSATTAASFLANLASALQPLREFGLFMGLCVMGAFVLLSLFLPPVFVLLARRREREAARKAAAPRSKRVTPVQDVAELSSIVPMPSAPASSAWPAASSAAPPAVAGRAAQPAPKPQLRPLPRKSCAELALLALVRRIEACPAAILLVTAACVVGFGISTTLLVEIAQGMPEVFPEGHNQFEVHRLQERFATVPRLAINHGSPELDRAACQVNASQSAWSQEPCSLYWCDAAPAPADGGAAGSCWRSPTWGAGADDGSEWGTEACVGLNVSVRVAGPSQPAGSPFDADDLLRRVADSGLQVASGAARLPVRELPPVVFEDWSTGQVGTTAFFDAGSFAASRPPAPGASRHCRVEVICFQGPQVCSLPSWRSMGPPSAGGRALEAVVPAAGRSLMFAPPTVPRHKRIDVTVVFGVRAPTYTPLVGALDQQWSFDPSFDLRDPWAQRAVHSFCTSLPAELHVVQEGSSCWIDNFRHQLLLGGKPFPSRDFSNEAASFHSSTIIASDNMWFVDGHVKAAKLVFIADVAKDMGAKNILKYKERWDAFVNERNRQASVTANQAYHTTSAWVLAEAEVAVVDGTVATILVSAACGFAGVLAFTGDPSLALMVLILVLGVIASLAFFMVAIMGWKLGPVEVISLVVFVGYSVTFSLHVAHLYGKAGGADAEEELDADRRNVPAAPAKACDACGGEGCTFCQFRGREQAPRSTLGAQRPARELRRGRTRAALLRVGGATLSSAASTAGSSFFLLFCTLRIFTKLGAVVIAVSALSCSFSLIVLPAALLLVGPGPGPWHERCSRWAASLRRRGRSDPRLMD